MMNQTQKRLQIIKLAISITDIETIQLQVSKLRLLEGDRKIRKIVELLETGNYGQAQTLIIAYIEMPIQTIHQRVASEDSYTTNEQKIIEKFNLFIEEESEEPEEEPEYSNADETVDILREMQKREMPDERVTPDNQKRNDEAAEDDFFSIEAASEAFAEEEIFRDPFFDTLEEDEPQSMIPEERTVSESIRFDEETIAREEVREEAATGTIFLMLEKEFQGLLTHYPPTYNDMPHTYPSVDIWLTEIAYHNPDETEINEVLQKAERLSRSTLNEEKGEAAQLLILSSLTENPLAKLFFARALYKGEIFQQNIAEAFKRISQLADEAYPEALCDLGQFYEHGIGTKKDRQRAKKLYKHSMDLGVKRAKEHYESLPKSFFF